MNTQYYDDIIIGGGKAGKTLAPALVADGRKTALVERSLNMIGGLCPNIACIPAKRWWQVQKWQILCFTVLPMASRRHRQRLIWRQ